jgi:hypothetical protein
MYPMQMSAVPCTTGQLKYGASIGPEDASSLVAKVPGRQHFKGIPWLSITTAVLFSPLLRSRILLA